MKRLFNIFTLSILSTFFLTACGAKVEVPPAHVGKILSKTGFNAETIPPSKFRLKYCAYPGGYCDKLILLEASDTGLTEAFDIFMPLDKLKVSIDVRGTYTIPNLIEYTDPLFDRVTSSKTEDSDVNIIEASRIYTTYGQQAIRGVVRSEIRKYTISQLLSDADSIGRNIHAAINEKLKETKTPIQLTRFELASIDPPKVIVDAQEAAKRREIDIQRANADAEVKLVEAERALQVAKKMRLVEREKAQAIAEQNTIAADSITPQLLAYRKLEVAESIYSKLAESDNTIIVPADSSGFSNINDEAVFAKLLSKEFKKQ